MVPRLQADVKTLHFPVGNKRMDKEEMMAYLDWSKAEDDRIEAQVAAELRDDPAARRRRGVKDIWNRIEK